MYEHSNNRKSDHNLGQIFFKIRVSFFGLVSKNKVFLEFSHFIERHIDVVLEVLDSHISITCELCIYEDFIEFW